MVVTAYDEIAEWYDAWVGDGPLEDDAYYPAVEALIGPVAGLRVCDLGCGQGRVARHLADRGARVVGVDLSAKLLAIARRREAAEPRGVVYIRDDARGLGGLREAAFDGVVCHMALMDIADLEPTLRAVGRVLRPGGWFAFAILHPCSHTATARELVAPDGALVRAVSGYFAEGFWRQAERPGPPGKVGAYHRTLSTYINALADAGLALERLAEPPATARVAERRPIWREAPAVLVAMCRKGA